MNGEDRVSPSEIESYLAGADYPKSKEELVDYARNQGAEDKVVSMLEKMPDKEYSSPVDVSKEIGNME